MGEVLVGESEFKADMAVLGDGGQGPGEAWVHPWYCSGPGAEASNEASQLSSSPQNHRIIESAALSAAGPWQSHHLRAGCGLAGKWRPGYGASQYMQSCGTAGESSAG